MDIKKIGITGVIGFVSTAVMGGIQLHCIIKNI